MLSSAEEILHYARQGQALPARNKLIDLVYDTDDDRLAEEVNNWCRDLYRLDQRVSPELIARLEPLAARVAEAHEQGSVTSSQPVITLSGVSKRYTGSSFQLNNVTLSIQQGEIIGIVGENGNGKTTLLNIVAQHLQKDSGTIQYHFLEHPARDRYAIRQHIGYIPQRIPRWHGSLRESLLFAGSCYGLHGAQNTLRVEQIMHRLDLWKFHTYTWNSISSGFKTRFEIARVLLGRPKLLVLDEPLANLDINTQQVLLNDLRHIAKSRRHPMAVLMSSQQLHEIENASDNIIFLRQGNCIFQSSQDKENLEGTMVEISLHADDNVLLERLHDAGFRVVSHTASFFVVTHSEKEQGSRLLSELIRLQGRIRYFRDISQSAKRFFNERK